MVFVTVAFGVLGLALILLGWWGARSRRRLGVVPGWDQKSVDRRRAMLRRGSYTCVAAGVVFLILATVSLVYRPDSANCGPPGWCQGDCAVTHHCQPVIPKR